MSLAEGTFWAILLAILVGVFIWLAVSLDGIRQEVRDRRYARAADERRARELEEDGKINKKIPYDSAPAVMKLNWWIGAIAVLCIIIWAWIMDSLWASQGANLHPVWTLFLVCLVVLLAFFFGGILTEALIRRSAKTHIHQHQLLPEWEEEDARRRH